ncbi:uncharacterized protein LOC107046899 [Diachasma alloeum]|uniref:uncharacterized protein LOC107046899 n=1 Tax=Diachasma alloeum TaxID=454923 RepID=UPI0010FB2E06|nr:uncharacterized protein LOC107046899 [Diachasma alloeum]
MLGEEIPSTDSSIKIDEEAPQVNLPIQRHMSEIAIKRDKHFIDTQNCVGTAIITLSAAISMGMNNAEDIDYAQLMKYLWDTGKLLCDTYHQQSIARKSFITPILDKEIKPTLDASISDKWLYGENLTDQVKDVKEIEKASASLKPPPKPPLKKFIPKNINQGNLGGPPTGYSQVGYYQTKKFTNVKYRPRLAMTRPPSKYNSEKTRPAARTSKK